MEVSVEKVETTVEVEEVNEELQDPSIDSNTSEAEVPPVTVDVAPPSEKAVVESSPDAQNREKHPEKVNLNKSPQKVSTPKSNTDSPSVLPPASPMKAVIEKSPAEPSTKEKSPEKTVTTEKSPVKSIPKQNSPDKEEAPKPDNSKAVEKIDETDSSPPKEPEQAVEKAQVINTSSVEITIEPSTDSQPGYETPSSEVSEKDHNKSLSRELRSLINSAKESKIISECTQLTSKTRKSRNLDTSLNDGKKVAARRGSDNSQESNSSERSDKAALKRSMRSQNPEVVTKQKPFLNSVSASGKKGDGGSDDEAEEAKTKEVETGTPKKKAPNDKITEPTKPSKLTDSYCWRCHWAAETANEKAPKPISCTVCPRSYHFKCLNGPERNSVHTDKSWVCPDCLHVMQAESSETRSPAMRKINLGMLCDLLRYALKRMMEVNGVEPFLSPVDRAAFPEYDKLVVHPMDLSLMKANIDAGYYGSTEAFTADVQWILHNSIIFNTLQAKLTAAARALYRSCKAEMGEIEACPECYAAAHARRPTWFTDVCSAPHILLWAKLKGFPYWPAKGMTINSAGMVDVRFFGAHDRAWVPARDCYLYSEKDPNNFKAKRQDIIDSMQEAEEHIRNISRKFGKFIYPAYKVPLEPTKLTEQLKNMIPQFEPESPKPAKSKPGPASVKNKRKSMSKIDGEDSPRPKRKAAEKDDDEGSEKSEDKTKKPEEPTTNKEPENSRKRRRSALEEAVLTVIDSKEKRPRSDPGTSDTPKDANTEDQEKKNKEDATSTPKTKSDKDTEKTPKIKPKGSSTPKIVLKLNLSKTPKSVEKLKAKRREKSTSIEKDKSVAKSKAKRNKSVSDADSSKSDAKTKESGKASPLPKGKASPKPKDDENTSLAVMKKKTGALNMPLLISNVRTLTKPNSSPKAKTDAKDNTKIFTPTSTDNVNTMKEAVEKLQTLRNNQEQSLVGKVGVRAFARMTSPNSKTNDCTVEVKAEPIDVEEAERERESEKIDLLNSVSLRPVNPTNLRDIRINKTTPVVNQVRKPCPKPLEIRPRAKKTFPQPKKPEEGPSGLNSKNSMVYIPIQPPATQAPRPPGKVNGPVNSSPSALRQQSPVVSSVQNTLVNTMTPPLMAASAAPRAPTAQVPAVHTVPFITSVNGQWTFSLQPVMAVGGQENSPPKLNGIDRPIPLPTTLSNPPPLVGNAHPPALAAVTPALTAAAMAASGLQPVQPPILLPSSNDKNTPEELPRLQKNPSLLLSTNDISSLSCDLPAPSAAGPVTQRMNLNAAKLADYFRNLINESLEKSDDPWTQLTLAKKQIETLTWKHQQQLKELRHNHELQLTEMRTAFEKDRARLAAEAAKTQADIENSISIAKSKQWCANCAGEAQFYCCWNTAYCDYPCQRAHWPAHAATCAQHNNKDGSDRSIPSEERLQPPDLPNITAPLTITKTVGGKSWSSLPPRIAPAPTALAAPAQTNQSKSSSIIVSMVEDTGGNQTVKCVGTYKAPNTSPLLINKQLMNNEENAAKKVVTSGGYLIVGAGAPAPGPLVIN